MGVSLAAIKDPAIRAALMEMEQEIQSLRRQLATSPSPNSNTSVAGLSRQLGDYGTRFNSYVASMPKPQELLTRDKLDTKLREGVASVVAGIGGLYRLIVDTTKAFVGVYHKDIAYNGNCGAYSGDLRCGIILTANGLAAGYNDKTTGAWKDGFSISSTGEALFSGNLYANGGYFVGEVRAGSLIVGSVTVNGQTLSDIAGNANAALSGLSNKLSKNGSDVLSGLIDVDLTTNTSGFRAGDLTWDASGYPTGGSGVAVTRHGIVGAAAGVVTFAVRASDGAAAFRGDISGATGTFSGSLACYGGADIRTNNLVTSGEVDLIHMRVASGEQFGVARQSAQSAPGWSAVIPGVGWEYSLYNAAGTTASYLAVENSYNGNKARFFVTSGGSLVLGKYAGAWSYCSIPVADNTVQAGLNASLLQGYSVSNSSGGIPLSNGAWQTSLAAQWAYQSARLYDYAWNNWMAVGGNGITSGGSVATFNPNNKPANSSSNYWLQIVVNGTPYYIPIWS